MQHPKSFTEFYSYYLEQHSDTNCRRLHFIGTGCVLLLLIGSMVLGDWRLLLAMPLVGYGFAWLGHFAFEKNKPAAFKNPAWSLMGDFRMFADICRGRIQW